MNPNVTFFYNQNESRGATWQATVRVRPGHQGSTGPEIRTITLYLYAGNGGSPPAIDTEGILDDGKYQDLLRKIAEQIRPGLLLEEEADDSGSELTCRSTGMEARAKEALRLRPGYPADFVPFDKKMRLAIGGHLIVPVDIAAQERLVNFLGQLKWLSPDIESLVLNTIWQPGVDRRIERIEKRLGIPQDVRSEGPTSWKKWLARGRRWSQGTLDAALRYSPVLASVLLVILLAGNTQISWSAVTPEKPAASTEHPDDNGNKPKGTTAEAAAAQGADNAEKDTNGQISEQLKKLDSTLSNLAVTNLELKLYTSHFSNHPVRSIEDLDRNEDSAWGFVKLVYLRLRGPVDLEYESRKGDIATIVGDLSLRSWARVMLEQMPLTEEENAVLALATCQAFGRNQAGLPGDSRPETDPDRDWYFQSVDMKQSCPLAGTELALAADGLKSLNSYLATLPKVGGDS